MGRGGEDERRGGRKERIVVAGRNVRSLPQMMCKDSPSGDSMRSRWQVRLGLEHH